MEKNHNVYSSFNSDILTVTKYQCMVFLSKIFCKISLLWKLYGNVPKEKNAVLYVIYPLPAESPFNCLKIQLHSNKQII